MINRGISLTKDNYDMAATVFSPDGRVYQVEYAREAIKRGGLAMAIKFKDGIVFSIMKTIHSHLLEEDDMEKFYKITPRIGAAASGLIADARVLIDLMREISQQERKRYGEDVDVKTLIGRISKIHEIYTRYEGVRPFGAAMVIGGFDESGLHLFETDPSGVYQERTATAIGNGAETAQEILTKDFRRDLSLERAVTLSCEIIKETMQERDQNGFEGIELHILTEDGVRKIDVDKDQDLMDLISGEDDREALDSFLDEIGRINKDAKEKLVKIYGSLSDLRGATMDDLMSVDGIGKATARKILDAI